MNTKRDVLMAFLRTLDRSSFVILEDALQFFPQLYNRLQWRRDESDLLGHSLNAGWSHFNRPWLRIVNNPTTGVAPKRTFRGHKFVIYFPDGKRVITASKDGALNVLEVASGKEIMSLSGHSGELRICRLSKDGKLILSVGDDQSIKVWEGESGKEIAVLTGHQDEILCCAFSPDGKRITSGSMDRTLRIWDIKSKNELAIITGHASQVNACDFSPDGKKIISASTEIKLWDALSGMELLTLKGHDYGNYYGVRDCAFSPTGDLILTSCVDEIKIWDGSSGNLVETLIPPIYKENNFVGNCFFSPDGRKVARNGNENLFHIWGFNKEHFQGTGNCLGFSPDGNNILVFKWPATLKLWDITDDSEKCTFIEAEHVHQCAFRPDGRQIIALLGSELARVWDVEP